MHACAKNVMWVTMSLIAYVGDLNTYHNCACNVHVLLESVVYGYHEYKEIWNAAVRPTM